LGNEFATVGFRAHSMVHGEFEPEVADGTYTDAQLAAFQAQGITIERESDTHSVVLVIPLSIAFGNPALLQQVGLGRPWRVSATPNIETTSRSTTRFGASCSLYRSPEGSIPRVARSRS